MAGGNRKRARARATSASLFLLVGALLAVLWWVNRREWRRGVEAQVELTADQAALRLEDYVEARLLVVRSFARVSAQHPEWLEEHWRTRAEIAQQEFGGFQALNWVDADSVIRIVTPLATNRGALGRRILDHPVARDAFEAARDSGEPRMTTALELFQGGLGFATYFPFEANGVRGYVNGVFRIEQLVRRALRGGVREGYDLQLADDSGAVLIAPTLAADTRAKRTSAEGTVQLLDRTWTLRVWPRDDRWEAMNAGRPDLGFALALVLLAMVAGAIHLALLRQIARDEAEAERKELARRLERTTKMESLGRLAGGVAHDFNNILTAILNSVELLEDVAEDHPDGRFAIDSIVDASSRAAELTRQLLTFAHHTPSPPADLDLNEQLRGLRQMLERLLPSTVALSLDLDPELPLVRASASHIGQIVVNLVVNAADAMAEGGGIELRTRRDRDTILLEVADTGDGMDAMTRERIFEPFFTTKEEGKGTGLGLATVYGIVQGYEGSIEVDSEPGVGSRFRIRLPAAKGLPTPVSARPAPERAGAPHPPRRILIVEDDPGVRRALRRSLRTFGHLVVEAGDGREALALFDQGETFDAVISDVLMPHIGGLELFERLRDRFPQLPIVLCSGHTRDRSELAQDERSTFLAKPFEPGEMQRALETLWAKGAADAADAADPE